MRTLIGRTKAGQWVQIEMLDLGRVAMPIDGYATRFRFLDIDIASHVPYQHATKVGRDGVQKARMDADREALDAVGINVETVEYEGNLVWPPVSSLDKFRQFHSVPPRPPAAPIGAAREVA